MYMYYDDYAYSDGYSDSYSDIYDDSCSIVSELTYVNPYGDIVAISGSRLG